MEPIYQEHSPNVPLPPATPEQAEVYVLPVSFAQRRLWFLWRLQPQSPYNLFGAWTLSGPLRRTILERSLGAVVQRHEVLRTRFALLDGDPVQVVSSEGKASLPVIDLRALDAGKRGAELDRLLRREAQRPFDLDRGPLLRVLLLVLEERQHVFFYTMHHIISDGWSEQILMREMMALYQGFSVGAPPTLPELPIQYGDFAHWQRTWLQGEVLASLTSYWQRQLDGAATNLNLPYDHPRPAVVSHRGASGFLAVPEETAQALILLSHREGATLFATLLAAFGILLYRHSGQADLLVGSPVANRDRVEIEDLIGLFLNTLVLRIDLTGRPTFRALLAKVRETVVAAQEHRDLPFERLVAELGLERDQSRNPLFQVFFNLDTNRPVPQQASLVELMLSPLAIDAGTAKFDLLMNVQEMDRVLGVALEYSSDLFEPATIERMLRHFSELLAGIASTPERCISELPLLTSGELQQILVDWNETRNDSYPVEVCLPELWDEQVRIWRETPAVLAAAESFSFGEIDDRAHRLARLLRESGVGPEVPVGIYMTASAEMVIAVLAILKAGGAYVPIDPAYPAERTAFLIEDAGLRIILTQERFRGALLREGLHVLCFDAGAIEVTEVTGRAGELATGGATTDNLAYVIYTSGSTGSPKGVMVPHRGLVNYLSWCLDAYGLERGSGALLHSSIGFDLSVTSLFAPLLAGRPVTVLSADRGAGALISELEAGPGFSFVKLTPAHLELVSRELRPGAAAAAAHTLILGGEALFGASLTFWRTHAPEVRLINEYGPTESVVGCCVYELSPGAPLPAEVPVGRPIANTRIYLLDPEGQPVPVSVTGELYIGGPQVARGYLRRPAWTAERFVPDPFAGSPGSRLYRTGDLGRYRPDGTIRYLGRSDHQVKIRGFRIEPGEVEAALLEHPTVQEAVVVAREESGERRLVAYLVAGENEKPATDELRRFLAEKLPEPLVPAAFVILESLPLTRNGKVDREALPAPGSARPALAQEYVPPRTLVEDALAAIWSAILRIDPIGVHDNFFALGGDSILTIQMVALAKSKGFHLTLVQIFRCPTIATLAREIRYGEPIQEEQIQSEPFSLIAPEDRALLPEDVEDAYPLSRLQAGMLYHMEEIPDAPLFHSINSWHLRMPFQAELFQQAVLHVTARHPTLRTSFDLTTYREPLQLVHRRPWFPVEAEDLRHLSSADQERELDRYRGQELAMSFDLSRPPQLRFKIHRRTDEELQFTLTENHAVVDGWSLHTLYDEILRCYFSLLAGRGLPNLPALRTTFRDFVRLERGALDSSASQEFWRSKLNGCKVLKVPRWAAHLRDTSQRRVKRFDITLDPELVARLRQLALAEATPLKSVLLAAHLKVMSFVGGERDVLTSLSSHGRPEMEDGLQICGLFLNTLPLRVQLDGGTWTDLVRQAYEAELEIVPHRRYPLAAIQKEWGRTKLLETSFVYLNFHVLAHFVQTGEIGMLAHGAFVEETNFAIMTAFNHGIGSSSLVLNLDCDRTVLSEAQIEIVKDAYLETLRAMAYAPEERYDAFSPLSPAARHSLLVEWNASGPAQARERPVHEIFEEQAEKTPGLIAVESGAATLTFRELNLRSNLLAHSLRRLGAGPEVRVAVCLERSLDMVVALLAVLKAGGAYVPIEPSSPPERLRFVLRDSGCTVMVTRRLWQEAAAGACPAILLLDADQNGNERQNRNPASGVSAENAAYVIYTSGSTGKPKGVLVEHRQLSHYLQTILEHLAPSAGDRYSLVSTFAADLGQTQIFGALTTGGTLQIVSEEQARDPAAMVDLLSGAPLDGLKIVPSHLDALLEHPSAETLLPRRWLILGGEALTWKVVERVRQRAPACRIFNEYGPTEATVAVMIREVAPDEKGPEPGTVPIGRPMAGSQIYLFDSHQQPVGPGASGELYIGGTNLARGYVGRPDLTAERFVPHPAGSEPGARLYRTGDLARHTPDGSVELLGRIDRQVKVHGFRIEPGEIEAVLLEHPAVRDAVVSVRSDSGSASLIAYVVAQADQIDRGELLRFAAERLPAFMLPAAFVQLDALPLTSNGKLDREALPAPHVSGPQRIAVPPRSPLELQLLLLWEEILETRPLGIRDDFFASGGDSLLAVRLVARVRKQLGLKLTLSTLVQARSIEKMAQALRQEVQRNETSHLVAIQPCGSRLPFFCVHPGHGGVSSYLPLAHHLGPEQPFFGLQALALDEDEDPYLSVEEMAGRYLREMRAAQPEGPYLLGGWSFGGLVAFEMARQLCLQGEEVRGLALIDARSTTSLARLADMDPALLKAYLLVENAKEIANVSARDLPITPNDLLGLELEEQLDRTLKALELETRLPFEVEPRLVRRYLELRIAIFQAIKNYRPQVYPGRITLFRAEDVYTDTALEEIAEIFEEAARSPTYGWHELTSQPLDLRWVSGHHENMVYEPHVRILAQELGRFLEECAAEGEAHDR